MIEESILSNLIHNEPYARKVLPFLKTEYFVDKSGQLLFDLISEYTLQYNATPSTEALKIELDNVNGISEEVYDAVNDRIIQPFGDEKTNIDFLINKTEDYCKQRAVYNAIVNSIAIIDGKDKKTDQGAIPKMLQDALGVSFDTAIGHDYLEDYEARYDFYHLKHNRIPFDIEFLNKITKGGLPRKTLSLLMSTQTGGGKSLAMCHMAAANIMSGQNVLYLTMELSEEMVSRRIDANLMNVTLDDLEKLPKDIFLKKGEQVKSKAKGKLIVKEFATGSAHAGHFRHLIDELRIKKNFIPDVIYVDYLNICSSSRVKMSGGVNTYVYVKAIAEELRGLAVEMNVAMVTATQGNKDAISNSDVGLQNTSESMGLPATVDLMLALITSEELEDLGQIMFKQLKNRHGPLDVHRRFVVGVDRDKMRLFDLSDDAQKSFQKNEKVVEDNAVIDKGDFVKRGGGKKKFDNWG